jgi:hypothetical protein
MDRRMRFAVGAVTIKEGRAAPADTAIAVLVPALLTERPDRLTSPSEPGQSAAARAIGRCGVAGHVEPTRFAFA